MEQLGTYLKQQRKAKNLTLRETEKKTGISNAYLSQLENSKISSPSPSILHKLATCYQVSYEYLMELAGYPAPNKGQKSNPLFSRIGNQVPDMTPEEEKMVFEYIRFLRSHKKP
jgi:transcriptional regulator with XRE-family HTH domain